MLGQLLDRAVQRSDLEESYTFRFPAEPGRLREIADVVVAERRCCPFFQFVITVEPNGTGIVLELTGPEGMKAFLRRLFPLE